MWAGWQNTQTSREHKRICRVTLMVKNCAVDGGNTHFIAVIFDAVHHTIEHTLRRQHTFGNIRALEWTKAQNIGICNWSCANCQHVTNHATRTRIRATERLEGARVIVRFDLERQIEFIIKFDHACVVLNRAANPRLVDFCVRRNNVALQQTIDVSAVRTLNFCPEGLMHTVFRPSLGDHLEFDICRISSLFLVIRPYCLHLG